MSHELKGLEANEIRHNIPLESTIESSMQAYIINNHNSHHYNPGSFTLLIEISSAQAGLPGMNRKMHASHIELFWLLLAPFLFTAMLQRLVREVRQYHEPHERDAGNQTDAQLHRRHREVEEVEPRSSLRAS